MYLDQQAHSCGPLVGYTSIKVGLPLLDYACPTASIRSLHLTLWNHLEDQMDDVRRTFEQ